MADDINSSTAEDKKNAEARVTDTDGFFIGTDAEVDEHLANSPIPYPIPDEMFAAAEAEVGKQNATKD